VTQHQNFSTSHYVFSLRWLVQVIFSRLNYHHFFFFYLNYHSDFYCSLKLLYIHQMIKYHLVKLKNFIDLFICLLVHLHTFITYLHLSLSILYAIYINLYSFFMSQRICTRCAHNHLIHEFLDSNSTYVLNLCSFLFINLSVYSYTLYASYMLHSTCNQRWNSSVRDADYKSTV